MASSDTKCKRCGKEVPVLSDCGGFYDLVPDAKVNSSHISEPMTESARNVNTSIKRDPDCVSVKKNGKKSLLGLTILVAAGFAAVILLLVIVLGQLNQYSGKVNGLRSELQIVGNELQTMRDELHIILEKNDAVEVPVESEITEPDVTETTTAPAPVLKEQNIIFTLTINGEDSKQKIDANLDLGDCVDMAVVTYSLDGASGDVNSACCTLKEANTEAFLTVERSIEDDGAKFSVSYKIDDTIFGLSEESETFRWLYRLGGDSDWKDLPEGAFKQADGAGKTDLMIDTTELQKLMDSNEGQLELRCEIFRTNSDNGSLTIVIDGIRFYEDVKDEEPAVG